MAGVILPQGPEVICFDATALMAFANAGHLGLLEQWFGESTVPTMVINREVGDWVKKYPANQQILDAKWLLRVEVDEAADIIEAERIRREYLGDSGDENRGEADVLVLCQRHGWTAALDDDEARRHADRVKVPHAMMLTMIIAAAAHGFLAPKAAWKVHSEVDAARDGGRSYLTGAAVHKPIFMQCCAAFREIERKRNPGDWPLLLTLPGLDEVVVHIRRAA